MTRSMCLSFGGFKMISKSQVITRSIKAKGIPNIIHSEKLIAFSPTRYFMATALGGVPIGVPTPPMFAASGMERMKANLAGSSGLNSFITGARIASIKAVVAVLLMNIEKTAVIIINPSMTNRGSFPKGLNKTRARLRSRRYLVAAIARKKPPRKSMMIGEAKVFSNSS